MLLAPVQSDAIFLPVLQSGGAAEFGGAESLAVCEDEDDLVPGNKVRGLLPTLTQIL